jgi:hypothetical protein
MYTSDTRLNTWKLRDYLLALEFSIKNIGISVANLISGSGELSRRSRS